MGGHLQTSGGRAQGRTDPAGALLVGPGGLAPDGCEVLGAGIEVEDESRHVAEPPAAVEGPPRRLAPAVALQDQRAVDRAEEGRSAPDLAPVADVLALPVWQ